MKNLSAVLVAVMLSLVLAAGCKSNKPKVDDDNNNPIYNSDPRLKDITDRIKANPENQDLYVQRAQMMLLLKMDSLAIKDYMRASALDTNRADYYSAIGQILFERKDLNGSVLWFQKAINKNPGDPVTHMKIAKLFLYLHQFTKGFEQIDIAMRKDVHNPEGYFLKGMMYKEMKDTAHAISSFETAVQEDPNYKDAIVQLGLIYSAKKDPVAMKYLDNAYKRDSTDVFPLFARGVYYQNNGDMALAKEEYRKCILKNRHFIDAYFNLGYILMHQDSIESAFRQYDIVTQLQPDNPTAYYDRGVCNERLKKVNDAIMDYKRAMALDTAYANPRIALKQLGALH